MMKFNDVVKTLSTLQGNEFTGIMEVQFKSGVIGRVFAHKQAEKPTEESIVGKKLDISRACRKKDHVL